MKDFEEALTSQGKHPSIPEEDNWFGPLVGTWDMEWIDGHGTEQERHVPGEWIFSWVLEGTAIQDIFICPSRQARKTKTWPDAAYGTTIRIYHPGNARGTSFTEPPGKPYNLKLKRRTARSS